MAGPFLFVFEDDNYEYFYPLTVNRAVYQLLLGIDLLYEKWFSQFDGYDCRFCIRNEIAGLTTLRTGVSCNSFKGISESAAIFVNGRYIPDQDFVGQLKAAEKSTLYLQDGNLVAAVLMPGSDESASLEVMQYWGYGHFKEIIKKLPKGDVRLRHVHKIWDFVSLNSEQIKDDFERFVIASEGAVINRGAELDERTALYGRYPIYLGKGSQVHPGVVINTDDGPVYIDENARIMPHSSILGPCYVGKASAVVGGMIRNSCSFGSVCKVGGEIEDSIILGYTNKVHDGFLGHAYLGEWVNLGAMTTNSDLKNNYGNIRVDLGDGQEDTRHNKVGSFIGDHVKTGIGTMLNTGIVIGFASNVFGSGLVSDKNIPPFCWGVMEDGKFTDYNLNKAMETARKAMNRRDVEFDELDKQTFTRIFDEFAEQRRAKLGSSD